MQEGPGSASNPPFGGTGANHQAPPAGRLHLPRAPHAQPEEKVGAPFRSTTFFFRLGVEIEQSFLNLMHIGPCGHSL
ncbi:hypothetical protein KSD_10650 [Ktedonobacter sp. SOSP1-85]|nr:hypothetical protein KSD_10650 [Ktedonobacter sp. SOSP1-85]